MCNRGVNVGRCPFIPLQNTKSIRISSGDHRFFQNCHVFVFFLMAQMISDKSNRRRLHLSRSREEQGMCQEETEALKDRGQKIYEQRMGRRAWSGRKEKGGGRRKGGGSS